MVLQDFTIKLPADLIQRMEEDGLAQDTASIERLIEAELKRREAAQSMLETFQAFDAIPDDEKPSEEEIIAEIKAYRVEKRAKS